MLDTSGCSQEEQGQWDPSALDFLCGLTPVGKVGQLLLSPWLEAHSVFNEHLENCSGEGKMGGSEVSFPSIHENACGTNLPASFSLQLDREDFQKYLVGSKKI